jgi:prepilin-type N-terminal cleavage/methylation domain-containing protein
MKNKFRARSAFSLIEISIVILIIGILIAGVTQSSRLVARSRLSNARALTQSSPVSSVKNLTFWVETTSEQSIIDSETEADSTVTTWYDLNPQTSIKANLSGSTTTRPKYKTNAAGLVNSLPTLNFDGTDDFMSTTSFSNVGAAGSSVFLLIKTGSTITAGEPILSKRLAAGADHSTTNIQVNMGSTTTGWQYCDSATTCYAGTGATIATNTAYVVSMIYTPSTDGGYDLFINGVAYGPTTTTSTPNTSSNGSTSLFVGKDGLTNPADFFTGNLGEVIIFDRPLKAEERDSIESYLGQKWGITVS